jgi:hypothetical protein
MDVSLRISEIPKAGQVDWKNDHDIWARNFVLIYFMEFGHDNIRPEITSHQLGQVQLTPKYRDRSTLHCK